MKLRKMVFRGARPLEFTMWKTAFENGNPEDFLSVISAYQNEDGGFGHNMEANIWNPNSSPEITSYALDQLERVGYCFQNPNHPIVKGILKYLSSGEYLTPTGWICGIPSNNEYSHAPWYGHDPKNQTVRILGNLIDFIFKYADSGGALYHKALALDEIRKTQRRNADPDFSNFDPSKYEPWRESPLSFVRSPDSERYPEYKELVDIELDAMVERLRLTDELPVAYLKEAAEWEDREQIIGNYYWASSDFISEIQYLEKFGRLDFQLPVPSEST